MREYYVRFPELRHDRARLLEALWSLLDARGITLRESGCEELMLEQGLQEHRHTGKVVTFRDLDDAVRRAQPWQGLVIHCNYPVEDVLGRLSIYLWNDQRPERISLMLGESSTLFNLQREQREPWLTFLQLVLDVTRAVSAPCRFMECNPGFQTLTVEEAPPFPSASVLKNLPVPLKLRAHAHHPHPQW